MADSDYEQLMAFASALARRANDARWTAITGAFRRDITVFGYRSPLDDLGIPCRAYVGKQHVPGSVMLATAVKDAPTPAVCNAFLGRGGTMIVTGAALAKALGLDTTTKRMTTHGVLPVTGSGVDGFALRTKFWVDEDTSAVRIHGGEVLVQTGRVPLVSSTKHEGGTIVVFSGEVFAHDRTSFSQAKVTPRELAQELGVAAPAGNIDKPFARDLFVAQFTMVSVLGDVLARALSLDQ